GEIVTNTGVGEGITVTLALAWLVPSVTVTTTEDLLATSRGATYRPLGEIVPTTASPPAVPFTNHSGPAVGVAYLMLLKLVLRKTEAVNCCDAPACTTAVVGEIRSEPEVSQIR